jgi:hypothetical protein
MNLTASVECIHQSITAEKKMVLITMVMFFYIADHTTGITEDVLVLKKKNVVLQQSGAMTHMN